MKKTGDVPRAQRALATLAGAVLGLGIMTSVSAEDRSFDGTGNNLANPSWGAINAPLVRNAAAEYADGVSAPAGALRMNPRAISNTLVSQDHSVASSRGLSDFVTAWGQFLDHDLDLSDISPIPEPMPILVPVGDPWFDPFSAGDKVIMMFRAIYDPATGTSAKNPRQQINEITSFIDASMVYGSDSIIAAGLRANDGTGKLKVSSGSMLPYNVDGFPMANPFGLPNEHIYLAGDVRCNENVMLTSMHTLWVREHNRLCDEIAAANPKWTDDQIYQRARRIVGALIQNVTYYEYLPTLLGDDPLPAYGGYDANVNPGIANEFSSAAFRFGHTQVNHTFLRFDENGNPVPQGHLPLLSGFFTPDKVDYNMGIEPYLRGLAFQLGQETDLKVVNGLRNFLFGPPGSGGLDLISLNLMRGRDHGLADYNAVRLAYGLTPKTDYTQITSDPDKLIVLQSAYPDIDDIDLWIGVNAEDDLPGASVGELLHAILVDQFTRSRDGDRFYFEGDPEFTAAEIEAIRDTRFKDVIERNTTITGLQDNVFFATAVNPPIFADVTVDGLVDVFDLLHMLGNWGPVRSNASVAGCDLDGSGAVNVFDLLQLLDAWGQSV